MNVKNRVVKKRLRQISVVGWKSVVRGVPKRSLFILPVQFYISYDGAKSVLQLSVYNFNPNYMLIWIGQNCSTLCGNLSD